MAGAVRPLTELDDSVLVSAAAAGNREAFDVLVERHRRTVYQVCYRFVNNHEDASDLAQDAFVRAWRGLKNFKGQSALSTWLYRIAVNVCLNRVSAKTPATEAIESTDHFEDVRIEGAPHAMIREERAAAVRKAIAGLPKKQRATLILRTYHDMSHQQIADVLGSSVGAVKANFFHALVNLKKILGSEP
jgi:RNA polymerase sigma-70 factor (ECF subfamily)